VDRWYDRGWCCLEEIWPRSSSIDARLRHGEGVDGGVEIEAVASSGQPSSGQPSSGQPSFGRRLAHVGASVAGSDAPAEAPDPFEQTLVVPVRHPRDRVRVAERGGARARGCVSRGATATAIAQDRASQLHARDPALVCSVSLSARW
jgi:hypothetical protein